MTTQSSNGFPTNIDWSETDLTVKSINVIESSKVTFNDSNLSSFGLNLISTRPGSEAPTYVIPDDSKFGDSFKITTGALNFENGFLIKLASLAGLIYVNGCFLQGASGLIKIIPTMVGNASKFYVEITRYSNNSSEDYYTLNLTDATWEEYVV